MTGLKQELIKAEIRRHLAMRQLEVDPERRLLHLLVADALLHTIEDPLSVLTE